MAEIPWIEWLTHSNFSFLTGASHPEDLVQAAANHGYGGIALADYDGVYGLVKAFRRQQQLPDSQSLQLFYGSELHLAADHDKPVVYRDSITLLALNSRGYAQLNRILSLAHRNSKKKALLPLPELLAAASSDLVCLQPMRGLIRHQELDIVMQRYALLKEAFGSNLFLLISRHLNPAEDHWIPRTLQLSKQLDIPYLFSQDAFFHEEKSKEICDVLQAIRLNKTLDTVIPQLFVNHERCLRSRMVLKQRYQALPGFTETLVRSQNLAQRFNFCLTQLRYHYPQELLPPGHSSQSYLEKICWEAAAQIFQAAIPPATESLLRKELALVSSLGFSDYFITVWDIVRWARSQNILCQGRGSAANSSVCFVLGITAINPNCFDMLFERFISVERGDPPDIDVDFEHERREEVIQYIYQRYGRNRAAMVANIISFRRRGAMRLVGKALGIPIDRIEENSRLHKHERGPLSSPLESSKKATQRSSKTHEYEDLWHDLAKRIEGFPQHMGIHSAGFVLNHEDIQNVCPIEPATMEGRTVIQWAK
ncbi:MAG: PHP domain-containing protein, partial [Proteobacteria bacterium]|nr:PHP domain-containing protein [Pseudomonadota bacterium]